MGGLLSNYTLNKIAKQEWAAMGYNGRKFEELSPWLKLPGKSGLQWAAIGDFREITPWLKLPGKSGLQWAKIGELLRNQLPWLKISFKGGLQWAAMGEFINSPG